MTATTGEPVRPAVPCLLALVLALSVTSAAARAQTAFTLSRGDGGETVELSIEQLEELPQTTVVTETEFTDGLVAFRGPLVRDVLALLMLDQAEMIRFTAANDYYVDIPTSDFELYDAILAMEADGTRLSRRDKGPLWLIYPFSDHPELRDPVYIARLIWQVVRAEAL